jgi:hypothetical protein
MSDYSDDEEIVKVEKNDPLKKNISLKNIEPVRGIKIIREHSDSESLSSDISSLKEHRHNHIKKTKKVLRRKEIPKQNFYEKPQEYDYSSFSNPKKVSKERESVPSESSYESESDKSEFSEQSVEEKQEKQKQTWEDKQKMKQDLLIKIQALEKKGFEFSKKFTMTSNYDEIMFEYQKIKKFIETQSAIKFSRRCLMACVTGLEFLNKRFDPFKLKLEGWSENVMENVDDYDNIFEKLHEKYGGKTEVAPEIELLLTLGGSAFMFHLTNTLLKGPGMGGSGLLAQNNPNFMASMMGAMSQGLKDISKPPTGAQMANMYQQQQAPPPTTNFVQNPQQMQQNAMRDHMQQRQASFPKPMETRGMRQEMKGPSIDQNLFNGTPLASNHPVVTSFEQPIQPIPPPQKVFYDNSPTIDEDDRFSIASSDSSLSSVSIKNVTIKKNTKKGKGSGGLELNIS